jgi:type I restriction enzyme S subunit
MRPMTQPEWTHAPLASITRDGPKGMADGPFGSAIREADYRSTGVPVIRGGNLALGDRRFKLDDMVFIPDELADRHPRAIAYADDIIFTKKGTIGSVGIIPRESNYPRFLISSNQMKATIDPAKAQPLYLYYVFAAEATRSRLIRESSATGVPKINLAYLRQFHVLLPPLPEQRRIAAILGALDDKIELNRKMNRTLEEMAQALFKSWFIDFDGHDDLVESEIGLVPRGWGVGTLADLADLNPESWTRLGRPASILYVDLSSTKWGTIESLSAFDLGDAPSRAQRILRPGDTIVGTVRPGNGSFALIAREGLTGSTGFAVLRPKTPANVAMTYLTATRPENLERLAHLADGGAYPAVRPELVAATPSVIPPARVLDEFTNVVLPLLQRIDSNRGENLALSTLRDSLLPKLISGEIRVDEAEAQIQEVL